jgi:hypothetical protein
VTEVPRVVARLLERSQDERGKGLSAAARLLGIPRDRGAHARGQARRLRRRQVVGYRRRRDLELREFGEEQLHRLGLRALVNPVERLATASGEEGADGLVRRDHELLDEHVRERLALDPGALDAALPVEGEGDLAGLDAQRPALVAAAAQRLGEVLREPERCPQLLLRALTAREHRLRLPVREPLAAPDEAAVEGRLAGNGAGAERDLDGDATPVLVRPQTAKARRELLGQHRLHAAGHVGGEAAFGGVAVERRAGGDVRGDVGDVHPRAHAVVFAAKAERVVEVLRLVGVDGEREEVAQVDAVRLVLRRRRWQRRMGPPHALVPEEALEHRLELGRRPEDALEARSASARPHHGEVADGGVARALAVHDDGDAALEVRLADQELAPPGQLDDGYRRASQRPGRRRACDGR